jgi:hypothetical protein
MTENPAQKDPAQKDPAQKDPAQKDPAEWTTGDEPMTAAQESYLATLAREVGRTCRTA